MNFNDAESIYTYTFEAEKKVRDPDIDSHDFEHIIVKFILCYTCTVIIRYSTNRYYTNRI